MGSKKKSYEWKKFNELSGYCQNRAVNLSLTWTKMGDWSVEIYIGYSDSSYEKKFFTDGHIKKVDAIKKALKWMKKYYDKEAPTFGTPQF